jgi:hypothetical protein
MKENIMKRPWFKIAVATVFGSAIALSCVAEAVVMGAVLPW